LIGIVVDTSKECRFVSVKLDSGKFQNYEVNSLKKIEGACDIMVGNYKIAIVNLQDDYYKKDYGFATYDEVSVGDLVVVNPKDQFCLGTVKQVLSPEEYGKLVTKEVVAKVDTFAYAARVEERNRNVEREKEKKNIQRQLDAKISKLRDVDFYERVAAELGSRDPEIVEMVNKLKSMM
jgi:hypothetical protein